jgi:outer membrane protein OmpA-like peptidoglycan-associated protein
MVVSESRAQARDAQEVVQAGFFSGRRGGLARGLSSMAALLIGVSLTGCSSTSSMNPINWWHRQEGGKIAQERPAPPGADQAYPNLATVPGKPEAPNKDEMKKLTDSLIADRTNAQHAAQSAPLADPSSPSASPSLFGVGTAPPPQPAVTTAPSPQGAPAGSASSGGAAAAPAASASFPAVTAPPAPATPPSAAPRKAVQSAPLPDAAPAAATPSQPAPSSSASGQAATAATQSSAAAAPSSAAQVAAASPATNAQPQPALPPGPPPRPAAAGAPPPPAPVSVPTQPATGNNAATIVFVAGSSVLSQPAADEVKTFAAKRGNRVISVTGYGDSTSGDPAAQSAAVTLGLSRAQQIFTALRADGVPAEAIRVNAEASGRGAALRLLQ